MRRRLHRAELRLSLNRKPLQCAKSTSASSNLIRSHLCIFIAQSVRRDVKAWQGIYIVLLANGDDKIAVSITIHLGVRASISICRALCSSPSVSGVYFAANFSFHFALLGSPALWKSSTWPPIMPNGERLLGHWVHVIPNLETSLSQGPVKVRCKSSHGLMLP